MWGWVRLGLAGHGVHFTAVPGWAWCHGAGSTQDRAKRTAEVREDDPGRNGTNGEDRQAVSRVGGVLGCQGAWLLWVSQCGLGRYAPWSLGVEGNARTRGRDTPCGQETPDSAVPHRLTRPVPARTGQDYALCNVYKQ